jgi:hypothetical protein|tara:strand:+ start:590 stop:1204 length:615 start_codon:yes stop_codon:yes gene_type:complete
MNSVYDFIIKPLGERYNNKVNIDNKELIINSSISDHKFVNRLAKVVSIPLAIKTNIKINDIVIVHHNLFRRYYNMKGESVNGSKYFKDDLYFASESQIYLYNNGIWNTNKDFCFIKPLQENNEFSVEKVKKNVGILKYGNSSLEVLGITTGDVVGFKSNREFEFVVDKQLLYCMESNDILIKYEHEENQREYNPSWAESGRRIN